MELDPERSSQSSASDAPQIKHLEHPYS